MIRGFYVELLRDGFVVKQYTIRANSLEDAKEKVKTLLNPGQKARIELEHYVMGSMNLGREVKKASDYHVTLPYNRGR